MYICIYVYTYNKYVRLYVQTYMCIYVHACIVGSLLRHFVGPHQHRMGSIPILSVASTDLNDESH